eukprot:m.3089 g.3089  ORF g.3089 m.3089 type:complete len:492 (+) comp2662_c0_seq1:437-1912(+)
MEEKLRAAAERRPSIVGDNYSKSKEATADMYRLSQDQRKTLVRMPGGGRGYSYRCKDYKDKLAIAKENNQKFDRATACHFHAPVFRTTTGTYIWSTQAIWTHNDKCDCTYVPHQTDLAASMPFTGLISVKRASPKGQVSFFHQVNLACKSQVGSASKSTIYRARKRVLHSLSARDLKKLEQGAKLRDIKSQIPPPPPEKPKQEREYRRQNAKKKGKPLKNEENNKPPVNKKLDIDLPPPPPLPHREESNMSADSETLKDKNYPTQLLCAAFSSEESEQEHLTPFKPSFNSVTTNVSLENNTQSPDLSPAEQLLHPLHPCRTQTDDAVHMLELEKERIDSPLGLPLEESNESVELSWKSSSILKLRVKKSFSLGSDTRAPTPENATVGDVATLDIADLRELEDCAVPAEEDCAGPAEESPYVPPSKAMPYITKGLSSKETVDLFCSDHAVSSFSKTVVTCGVVRAFSPMLPLPSWMRSPAHSRAGKRPISAI